ENVSYLFIKLKHLFMQLQFRKKVSSFPPTDFLEFLESTRYSLGQQEDCSEFLGFLLNTLREQNNSKINTPSRSGLNDSVQPISSCVCKSFAGKILTCLLCGKCSRSTENLCEFLELHLAFPNMTNNQSVQSLLLNHLKMEFLTGDDHLYCQTCAKLTDCYKETSIAEAPVNLIITLMIFKQDSTSNGSKKLFGRFEIDEHFNLADHYYNIHAVIVHCGSGVEFGHYYALVKDETDWFKFDDSRVTKCSGDVLNLLEPLETPYILFYEREDIGRSRSSDDVVLQVFPGFPAAEKANAPLESMKSPRSAN
ncbi:hypothetical protein GO639_04615, partial [Staphylococcus aureus]|nr:hypothetical protein [Staphylococcus aureus]